MERPLTSYQFELLCVLAMHAGRVMSPRKLMDRVRGEEDSRCSTAALMCILRVSALPL